MKMDERLTDFPVAQLTILKEVFFNISVFCYFWIVSYLAITVGMYRHCEEERRSNPEKNNVLNH